MIKRTILAWVDKDWDVSYEDWHVIKLPVIMDRRSFRTDKQVRITIEEIGIPAKETKQQIRAKENSRP
jgi:hypothetical protein